MIKQHYVQFASPGTFVPETRLEKIDKWDVDEAVRMARSVTERHGATPYGFQFVTRGRMDDELDSKVIETSNFYYLGGKVETLEEIEARNAPDEEILRSNMRCNGYDRVLVNNNSFRSVLPLRKEDVILDY